MGTNGDNTLIGNSGADIMLYNQSIFLILTRYFLV